MSWLNLVAIPLLARFFLVCMFPPSGLDKIVHWHAALKQADSSILPKPAGPPMLVAAILIEWITPICIVLGWHDRLAAFVLAGFCAITAALFHPFWRFPGFWSPQNKDANAHLWDFLKNFGLVGGLLLIVIGGALTPAGQVLRHPLSSAPYAASPAVPSR